MTGANSLLSSSTPVKVRRQESSHARNIGPERQDNSRAIRIWSTAGKGARGLARTRGALYPLSNHSSVRNGCRNYQVDPSLRDSERNRLITTLNSRFFRTPCVHSIPDPPTVEH